MITGSPAESGAGNQWARKDNAVAVYSPDPGDRIRILLRYRGHWLAVLWLQVSKDGSIYLGPRLVDVSSIRKGTKRLEGGQVSIGYDEGEEVKQPGVLRNPKVSFHATGAINAGGERLRGESLRGIREQRTVCKVLFQHPSSWVPISRDSIRKRDICLEYPIDEARPLTGALFVAPYGKEEHIQFKDAAHRVVVALTYSDLENVPDVLVQLALWHGVEADWPPSTYILYAHAGG